MATGSDGGERELMKGNVGGGNVRTEGGQKGEYQSDK